MIRRIITATIWIIERVPFLRGWILKKQSSKKKETVNPNIYTLH